MDWSCKGNVLKNNSSPVRLLVNQNSQIIIAIKIAEGIPIDGYSIATYKSGHARDLTTLPMWRNIYLF